MQEFLKRIGLVRSFELKVNMTKAQFLSTMHQRTYKTFPGQNSMQFMKEPGVYYGTVYQNTFNVKRMEITETRDGEKFTLEYEAIGTCFVQNDFLLIEVLVPLVKNNFAVKVFLALVILLSTVLMFAGVGLLTILPIIIVLMSLMTTMLRPKENTIHFMNNLEKDMKAWFTDYIVE